MAAATETPKFTPSMVASLFDEFDSNGDGKLDVSEFQVMCSGLGFAFPEEKAVAIMESLDTDGDGALSRGELAVFLASPAAAAAEATGVTGAALRTALLTRFAGHAGASLVRRASSEGSVEPVKPDATELVGKFRVGLHDEGGAPLSLKLSIRPITELTAPPAGLSSGKGLAMIFDTFDDADIANMCSLINAKLAESPPPTPPGVTVSVEAVTVEGDACAGLFVDAPMLTFPPELGMMFGVGDLAEAFEGFHYDLAISCSKSVDDIVHSIVPVADGLTLAVSGDLCIPKHVLNMVLNLVKMLGAGSPFSAMLPHGVAPLVAVYASMFKILDKYSVEASLDSANELIEMARSVVSTLPGHVADTATPAVDAVASTALGERHAEIVSEIASGMDEETVAAFRTLKGLRSIHAFVGPLGLEVRAKGLTLPYTREAADLSS